MPYPLIEKWRGQGFNSAVTYGEGLIARIEQLPGAARTLAGFQTRDRGRAYFIEMRIADHISRRSPVELNRAVTNCVGQVKETDIWVPGERCSIEVTHFGRHAFTHIFEERLSLMLPAGVDVEFKEATINLTAFADIERAVEAVQAALVTWDKQAAIDVNIGRDVLRLKPNGSGIIIWNPPSRDGAHIRETVHSWWEEIGQTAREESAQLQCGSPGIVVIDYTWRQLMEFQKFMLIDPPPSRTGGVLPDGLDALILWRQGVDSAQPHEAHLVLPPGKTAVLPDRIFGRIWAQTIPWS